MAIDIITPAVHRIALCVLDYECAKQFYLEMVGFHLALEVPGLFIFLQGSTAIAILPAQVGTKFLPHMIGLNHIALACQYEAELERVADALHEAGIDNIGVKTDNTLSKRYIAFKDPDSIAWEFYMV